MTNTLTAFFLPLGWAGAVFAIACALVVLVAIARGAAGLTGGAMGFWFIGALVSVVSSFAYQWTPVLIAVAALTAALVVGGMARMLTLPTLVRAVAARPAVASAVVATSDAPVSTGAQVTSGPAARTQSVRTQPVQTSGSPATA